MDSRMFRYTPLLGRFPPLSLLRGIGCVERNARSSASNGEVGQSGTIGKSNRPCNVTSGSLLWRA